MTQKNQQRLMTALSWICSAIILAATFYIAIKL
jgi:hypothetical protein